MGSCKDAGGLVVSLAYRSQILPPQSNFLLAIYMEGWLELLLGLVKHETLVDTCNSISGKIC